MVHLIAQLLLKGGMQSGDRAIIYAKNSPLWLMSDLAISFAGGVTAPVYETLGLDNIIYCVNLVQAKVVLVTQEYLPNILGSLDQMPSVL